MFNQFRLHYRPIQPAITQGSHDVIYREHQPAPALAPLIYCYWELKTTKSLQQPFVYRVVADGCIDIFFDLLAPRESFVMGFSRTYTEFPLPPAFHYAGVRFYPTAFPQLFNTSAVELTDRFEMLEQVHAPTASYITNNFHEGLTTQELIIGLDQLFLTIARKTVFNADARLYSAIDNILTNFGSLSIESLDVGISPRQLRRIFDFYVGDSPKMFSKVVRFQNVFAQSATGKPPNIVHGYYDQAHFIKEFRNFYGTTPSKAFQ